MRVLRGSLPSAVLSLGILWYAITHVRALLVSAVLLADMRGSGAPTYMYAGIPFVVQERYATQLCIPSR
jgi:hypothetical protein